MGIFKKFNFGLTKTRNKMSAAMEDMLDSFDSIEDDLYTELEEILVMSDVGVTTALQITQELRERVRKEKIRRPDEVKNEVKEIIAELLDGGEDMGLVTVPSIILVIGVNGVGKTTTIGKMAAMYTQQGKKVILGAADTFRAAAIDQLDIWAQRTGVEIVKHKEGADPAAVVFDTINAGKSRNSDIIIIDTAGRLHNKKNLMDELAKMYRVMDRELPYSDREVLLVLDATTGQNAVSQAKEFKTAADITGIVLTKLDGTARGGVVLAIKNELKIPVKFVCVGEQVDDLQPFSPRAFAEGLFESLPDNYVEEESTYHEQIAAHKNSDGSVQRSGKVLEAQELGKYVSSYSPEGREDTPDDALNASQTSEAKRVYDPSVYGFEDIENKEKEGDSEHLSEEDIKEAFAEVAEAFKAALEEEGIDRDGDEDDGGETIEAGTVSETVTFENTTAAEEPETETEAGTESEAKAEAEPEAEAEAEPEAEAEAEPEAEAVAVAIAEPEAEAVAEPEAEAVAEPEAEAVAEPEAEAVAEPEEEPEAEPEAKPAPEPAEAPKKKERRGLFGFFNRHS